jgi:hypothetical protein
MINRAERKQFERVWTTSSLRAKLDVARVKTVNHKLKFVI